MTTIDIALVDEMLEAGCTGIEVAARLGVHPDSVYRRISDVCGVGFAAYRQQKIASGDQKLREKLFSKALSGDTATLIFLGKTRLGMNEKLEVEHGVPSPSNVEIKIGFRSPDVAVPGEAKGKKRRGESSRSN